MVIYELSVDSSDASELQFPISEQKEKLLELIDEKISNGISVKDEWDDFLILNSEPKVDMDFYDIDDVGVCILNQKTYKLFSSMFDDSIELLPLKSDDQIIYILNVIQTTDCLNKDQSVYTFLESGQIMEFEKLTFFSEKITCPFFRIPEMPFVTLISEKVLEAFYANDLRGLNLSEDEFIGEG